MPPAVADAEPVAEVDMQGEPDADSDVSRAAGPASERVVELSEKPRRDTDLYRTVTAASTGAVMGARAVTDASTGGLAKLANIFGTMTPVTFVMLMFFMMYRDSNAQQRARDEMLLKQIDTQRESDAKLREAMNTELRGFGSEFRTGMSNLSASVTELRSLVRDLRVAQAEIKRDKE